MSENPRQSRRPAGTPAGGQFAPTNRPDAENVDLVDEEMVSAGSIDPDEVGEQMVVLDPSVLDDVVVELEAILDNDSRDSNESAFWDDEAWRAHLEDLFVTAYQEVAVFCEDGSFRLELGRPRPEARTHEIEERLRDLGSAPLAISRHTNPDGSIGGFVASSAIVDPTAWVAPGARVLGEARVTDASRVLDRAVVRDQAIVAGSALVCDDAIVKGRACVLDRAVACDKAEVSGDAVVCSAAMVLDRAKVTDRALVAGFARLRDRSVAGDRSIITGHATLGDHAELRGIVRVAGEAVVSGRTVLEGERVLAGCEVA